MQPRSLAAAYAACEAHHPAPGPQLLLRHPAAAAAKRARCARSTRWPAGSTTSVTATSPPKRKSAALAEVRGLAGRPRPTPADPVLVGRRRRRAPLPDPDGGVRRAVDGVAMDVEMDPGGASTGLRRPGRLLPLRRRLGRPALPGHLRLAAPTRTPPRYADALGIALQQTNILRDIREDLVNGRVYLPRDELDRVRRRRSRWTAGRRWRDPDGGLAGFIGFAAEPGPHLVRRRPAAACPCSTGAAPRAPPRWPASTAGCSTDIAADPPSVYDRRRVAVAAGRRPASPLGRCRPGAVRSGAGGPGVVSVRVAVVGGGLAGIAAALRCADAGREVTLLEVAHPAGRADRLVPPRRRWTSTTGSTCSCAAAPPTARCWTGSASSDHVHLQRRLDIPVARARPGDRARLRRDASARAAAPRPAPGRATARSPPADRLRIARGRAGAAAGSTRPTRPPTGAASATGCARTARAGARRRRAVGPDRRRHAQRAARARLAGAGRDGVPAWACSPTPAAGDIGWARVPLRAAARRRRAAALAAAGVEVRTGDDASTRSDRTAAGWRRRRRAPRTAGRLVADHVVLAVPPRRRTAPAARRRSPPRRAGRPARAAPDRQRARASTTGGCSTSRSSPPSTPRCSGCSTAPRVRPGPSWPATPSTSPCRSPPPTDLIRAPVATLREGCCPPWPRCCPPRAAAPACSTSS